MYLWILLCICESFCVHLILRLFERHSHPVPITEQLQTIAAGVRLYHGWHHSMIVLELTEALPLCHKMLFLVHQEKEKSPHVVNKAKNLTEFFHSGGTWHLCDSFNFFWIMLHAFSAVDVAKVPYFWLSKTSFSFIQLHATAFGPQNSTEMSVALLFGCPKDKYIIHHHDNALVTF